MTGLEKIIEKIATDSSSRCAERLSAAEKKAFEIVAAADAEAERILSGYEEENAAAFAQIKDRAAASADQLIKQSALSARIKAINTVIEESAKTIKALPADEYFEMLVSLCSAYACEGEGIMLLSEKDLKRLPAGFEKKLASSLKEGCAVKISPTAAEISDGFVLVYGDIEINCTVDALIDEKREELKEIINSIIF